MSKYTGLVVLLLLAPLGVSLAADFDGSKALRCVPTDAMECSGAGECARVTVEEINVPRWIYVDFAKKKLSGTDSDGEQKTTPIQNIRKADGRWCMAPDPGASWRRIP